MERSTRLHKWQLLYPLLPLPLMSDVFGIAEQVAHIMAARAYIPCSRVTFGAEPMLAACNSKKSLLHAACPTLHVILLCSACNVTVILQVHLLSTSNPSSPPQLVQPRIAGLEYFISHRQGQLFILTNAHGAVNYQLMTAPVQRPGLPSWRTLIPERKAVALRDLEVFATCAVMYENHGIQPRVSVLSLLPEQHTTSMLQQKQDPGHKAVAEDHPDSDAFKEAMQADQQPQQQIKPADHPLSQQQQQKVECYNMQQSTQAHKQQGVMQQHYQLSQQVANSGDAHLQTINTPPWVTSIETGANLDHHGSTVRLKMASPVHPQHTYDYHLETGQLQLLAVENAEGHDSADYVCQVQYATSHDGVQVCSWGLCLQHSSECYSPCAHHINAWTLFI